MAIRNASVSKTQSWPPSVALVGAGHMGCALLAGWLERGLAPERLQVYDIKPSDRLRQLQADYGFALNVPSAPPAVLVLAFKPQDLTTQGLAGADTLMLSILAGKSVAALRAHFPDKAIVRLMPNMPTAVGRGACAGYADAGVSEAQRGYVETLMQAVGHFVWLEDEAQVDAVTALSGSGPAYVFALVEAMAAAGAALGLRADLAESLARATVEGAGALMSNMPQVCAATLRHTITSPNGTTAAALAVLQEDLNGLLLRAMTAAYRRAQELGER